MTKNKSIWLRIFAVSALGGTLGDATHLLSGATDYPRDQMVPYFFGIMPSWVPLLMGTGGLIGAFTRTCSTPLLSAAPREPMPNAMQTVGGVIFFLALYGISGFIPGGSVAIAPNFILYSAALIGWKVLDGSRRGLIHSALFALGGTSFEIGLVNAGGFFYLPHQSNLFGVPSWLPSLYLGAGTVLGLFTRRWFSGSPRDLAKLDQLLKRKPLADHSTRG